MGPKTALSMLGGALLGKQALNWQQFGLLFIIRKVLLILHHSFVICTKTQLHIKCHIATSYSMSFERPTLFCPLREKYESNVQDVL